ncbi:MAG: MerR family transcriptional regulator [Actinomycetota bacterium]|nr:MerR family transcriptional regulator [Actinomycetota bacterium]
MSASRDDSAGHIRIGELSRRVGVSVELLRAWERRYQLLTPSRTTGGLRLYGQDDEHRVVRMLEHLAGGVSATEAARLTRRELETQPLSPDNVDSPPGQGTTGIGATGEQLGRAFDRLDETGANAALDRLLSGFTLETAVRDVVLPYLHKLGERWQRSGDSVIGTEHFASALLRGRLLGLARGWGGGYGPVALLASFPGDQHDLGLICFGLALRANGWRIVFLGADTPLSTVTETALRLRPRLIVLTAVIRPDRDAVERHLAELGAYAPLALAGGGIDESDVLPTGARFLADDPFTAAAAIASDLVASAT